MSLRFGRSVAALRSANKHWQAVALEIAEGLGMTLLLIASTVGVTLGIALTAMP